LTIRCQPNPGQSHRHQFDWAHPSRADNLHEHYFTQACRETGLGSVRFYDLRHTFATINLSAGETTCGCQSGWDILTFVLTLTTYADYINEDEQAAPKVGRGCDVGKQCNSVARRGQRLIQAMGSATLAFAGQFAVSTCSTAERRPRRASTALAASSL